MYLAPHQPFLLIYESQITYLAFRSSQTIFHYQQSAKNYLVHMYFHIIGDVSSDKFPDMGFPKVSAFVALLNSRLPWGRVLQVMLSLVYYPTAPPIESIVRGFRFACLIDKKLYLSMVLMCISLIVSDGEYFFMFQNHLFYIFVNHLVMFYSLYFLWVLVFFLNF